MANSLESGVALVKTEGFAEFVEFIESIELVELIELAGMPHCLPLHHSLPTWIDITHSDMYDSCGMKCGGIR